MEMSTEKQEDISTKTNHFKKHKPWKVWIVLTFCFLFVLAVTVKLLSSPPKMSPDDFYLYREINSTGSLMYNKVSLTCVKEGTTVKYVTNRGVSVGDSYKKIIERYNLSECTHYKYYYKGENASLKTTNIFTNLEKIIKKQMEFGKNVTLVFSNNQEKKLLSFWIESGKVIRIEVLH